MGEIQTTPVFEGGRLSGPECGAPRGFTPETWRLAENMPAAFNFHPKPEYETYLQFPKVMLTSESSEQLIEIHNSLSSSDYPRHLDAAASSAVEASLSGNHMPSEVRLELIDRAKQCWERAKYVQDVLNYSINRKEYLAEDSASLRFQMQQAFLPIYKGLVTGGISDRAVKEMFLNVLEVAQVNTVKLNLAEREVNHDAIADHRGLAHECNALLIFALSNSATRIAVPAFSRSDSGYFNPEQSHDIQLIEQKWGNIRRITPIEIKASASLRDRNRYLALIIRGKMHMTPFNSHHPSDMLSVINSIHEDTASKSQLDDISTVREAVYSLVASYKQKTALSKAVLDSSYVRFAEKDEKVAS